MGAGFAIAMRNLEIRGAGNILGTEQSGHIAAVGYELYCELLEQAVRRLRELPPKTSIEVDVDLPGEGYLPRSYVPDMRLKIDLYRRLRGCRAAGSWTISRRSWPIGSAHRLLRCGTCCGWRKFALPRAPLANQHDPPGGPLCGVRLHVRPTHSAVGGRRRGPAEDCGWTKCLLAVGSGNWPAPRPFSRKLNRCCNGREPMRIIRAMMARRTAALCAWGLAACC